MPAKSEFLTQLSGQTKTTYCKPSHQNENEIDNNC